MLSFLSRDRAETSKEPVSCWGKKFDKSLNFFSVVLIRICIIVTGLDKDHTALSGTIFTLGVSDDYMNIYPLERVKIIAKELR